MTLFQSQQFSSLDDDEGYDDEDFRRQLPQDSKTLLGALSLMVNRDRYSDVIFHVGRPNEPKRTFHAHRIILASASPIFEAMLFPSHLSSIAYTPFTTSNKLEIHINDCSPRAFRLMLQCLYTDKCDIKAEDLSDLIFIAKKYNLDPLKSAIAHFFETGITVENACFLFSLSLKEGFARAHSSSSPQVTTSFIEANATEVLRSPGFLELPAEAVRAIISSDRLDVDEVSLFKCLLRWAQRECARRKTPNLSSYSTLLEEDIASEEQMKRDLEAVSSAFRRPKESVHVRAVLEEVLDCVRFPLMSPEEMAMEIMPVGLLSDKDLVELFTYICATKEKPPIRWNTKPRQFQAIWRLSSNYFSPAVVLSHGNLCVSTNTQGHHWCLGALEMKPKSGKYCWRIFRLAGPTQWLMVGVSPAQLFPQNSHNAQGVWALSSNAQLYKNGVNNAYNGQVNMYDGPIDCEFDTNTKTFSAVNLRRPNQHYSFSVDPAMSFFPHIGIHSLQKLVVLPIKSQDFGQIKSLSRQRFPPDLKPLNDQLKANIAAIGNIVQPQAFAFGNNNFNDNFEAENDLNEEEDEF